MSKQVRRKLKTALQENARLQVAMEKLVWQNLSARINAQRFGISERLENAEKMPFPKPIYPRL